MIRVDVVAADGTVAVYFQQFYTLYGQLSVNILIRLIIGVSEIHFWKLINFKTKQGIVMKRIMQGYCLVYVLTMV